MAWYFIIDIPMGLEAYGTGLVVKDHVERHTT